jgi:pimeloyl-ACP methyl ester carboxylesterase
MTNTLDIGDTRLHCMEQGSGTPVVFVHGGGGDWRTWEPLRPHIAAAHRFIAYSRRYHWPNDAGGAGRAYTVPEQARDLLDVIQALGAGPVHAVGGSYGARVVLEAAVTAPQSFRSIAVSEPFITPPVDPADVPAAKALADDLARIAEPMQRGDTAGATVQMVTAVFGDAAAWERLTPEARQRFLDNQGSWIALARAPQLPPTPCEALGRLPMPVLVLEGADTVAGFRVTNDRLMQCLPAGAQRYVVPGAPHLWYPANPGDAARRLLEFITGAEA